LSLYVLVLFYIETTKRVKPGDPIHIHVIGTWPGGQRLRPCVMLEKMIEDRPPATAQPILQLADWRRRVAELYARIRDEPDPATAWRDWRRTRDRLFAGHPQSPLPPGAPAALNGIPCYSYDPSLRFLVALEPTAETHGERLEIGADGTVQLVPAGRTNGLQEALGGELTVYWITGYGGGLFLPFTDTTSGGETYGGGRYLLDGVNGADLGMEADRLVLDFNFAYHPSCTHSADWTCPLAPPGNRLPGPVRGGERLG
jgi:uncharacterized protein (DUF1684 family)